MIDLHIHTTFSDGSYTPNDIIKLALKNNLKTIAITDHDTVAGLKNISFSSNLEIINGIEFSTNYNGMEIHILGYFIDIENKILLSFLKDLEKSRNIRNNLLIEKLNKIGLNISLDYVNSLAPNGLITKAHFAKAIVEKGYCKTTRDAFSIYLGNAKPAYISRDLVTYHKAISIIKECGGSAVLAHPILYNLSTKDLEKMIKDLKENGLEGIECYYPAYNLSQTNKLLSLCEKYNLGKTAGSDFHGTNRANVSLGNIFLEKQIDYKILEDFKNIINLNN